MADSLVLQHAVVCVKTIQPLLLNPKYVERILASSVSSLLECLNHAQAYLGLILDVSESFISIRSIGDIVWVQICEQ